MILLDIGLTVRLYATDLKLVFLGNYLFGPPIPGLGRRAMGAFKCSFGEGKLQDAEEGDIEKLGEDVVHAEPGEQAVYPPVHDSGG